MAKAMAQELAVHGIRVNVVAPGIILAGLSKVCYETDPKYGPRATAAIPLREFGTPEQCADAFLFLASDESDYITGISLLVDGGASLPRRDLNCHQVPENMNSATSCPIRPPIAIGTSSTAIWPA